KKIGAPPLQASVSQRLSRNRSGPRGTRLLVTQPPDRPLFNVEVAPVVCRLSAGDTTPAVSSTAIHLPSLNPAAFGKKLTTGAFIPFDDADIQHYGQPHRIEFVQWHPEAVEI